MITAFTAALAASLLIASAAAQPPAARRLKHDPFDWSTLQQASEKKSDAAPPARGERSNAAPVAPPPAPMLRAVMRGPSGARVNLEGAILAIGESVDGYRLLEVRDYSAVFAHGGANIEIEIGRRPQQ